MNVIVSNKYQSMLQSLNIDIIKNQSGEFEVEELISTFQNFYYQRMILDITAIKNYKDVKTLQKLSISLDMDKIILLLDDSAESTSSDYLSKLISMGIYNFTRNIEGIMYLYHNPNSYRDVAHIHQLDNFNDEDKTQFVINVTNNGVRIVGVKNVTKQSGATSLIYMMKKQLERNYSVVALEVDKRDFMYFKDKEMLSVVNAEVGNTIAKHSDCDIILIDINNSVSAEGLCHDIIYLIEPSVIKLNKLMMLDGKILERLKNKKVILNQSMLSSKDVLDFEYESRIKVFYNMPPLDEREKEIHILNVFLTRLGFDRQKSEETEKKNKLLGLFNI
jgi:hypothetical protein